VSCACQGHNLTLEAFGSCNATLDGVVAEAELASPRLSGEPVHVSEIGRIRITGIKLANHKLPHVFGEHGPQRVYRVVAVEALCSQTLECVCDGRQLRSELLLDYGMDGRVQSRLRQINPGATMVFFDEHDLLAFVESEPLSRIWRYRGIVSHIDAWVPSNVQAQLQSSLGGRRARGRRAKGRDDA
jgi:hypothetical protein